MIMALVLEGVLKTFNISLPDKIKSLIGKKSTDDPIAYEFSARKARRDAHAHAPPRSRARFCVSAGHTRKDLEFALDLLAGSPEGTGKGTETVLFLCQDCADPRLWADAGPSALAGATVVFTCSIMFDEALMNRLVRARSNGLASLTLGRV